MMFAGPYWDVGAGRAKLRAEAFLQLYATPPLFVNTKMIVRIAELSCAHSCSCVNVTHAVNKSSLVHRALSSLNCIFMLARNIHTCFCVHNPTRPQVNFTLARASTSAHPKTVLSPICLRLTDRSQPDNHTQRPPGTRTLEES